LLWDAATGAPRGTLDLGAHNVATAPPAFSADGRLLAAADADDNAIRVFDVASEQPISEPLAYHAASAAPTVFLADGRLVTAGADEAAVWQLDALARPLETIVNSNRGGPLGTVSGALGQFTPDGTELITVGFADHRVLAWDTETGAPHGDLLGGQIATVGRIDFSPDAKTIVAAGLDGTFTLWDRIGARKLATVKTGQTGLVGVAWDPHAPTVVTSGAPGSVLFWDVSHPRHPVEQPRRALTALAGFPHFSPDGRFIVIVGGGPPATSATVFDVATGRKLLDFGGGATLPQVSFTPDSAILAAVIGQFNSTGEVALWDTTTWHRRATLTLPYSPGGIAFINDGTRFVTPSILPAIGRIDLWDTATLQPVGEPLTAPTTESLFSNADPRGTKIAIGSYSGITTVLDVDPRSWERAACRLAGRNLTRTEWKQYVPGQSYRRTCPQWPAGR
jgi:WD40 repeat protein